MKRTSWWLRLSAGQRAGLVAAALVLHCCGGLGIIGAVTGDDQPAAEPAAAKKIVASVTASTSPSPSFSLSPSPSPVAVKTTKRVSVTKPVAYKKRQVKDGNLPKGETEERTAGVKGERTLTYEVTLVDGRETGRKLLSDKVTRKPVAEVIAVGTYAEPDEDDGGCAPGYDPCVPVASDVDCAGGSGNGPAYVDGPVSVTGSDPYDLDRDGDGIACGS